MALKPHQLIVTVSDIDRAEAFYSHLLEIPGRRGSPGQHHFDCGGIILTCYDPRAEGESSDVSSAPHQVYFVVDDLEAVLERAKDAGCTSLDEQIVTKPWGDRSFCAGDPFENPIGFVDEMTIQRKLGSQVVGGPDNHLGIGLELSMQLNQGQPENQLVASVIKIFKDEIWLKLAQSAPDSLFKEGEQVQIQYRHEQAVFSSVTQIVKAALSENQYVAISIPEEAKVLQRRAAPRICVEIPLSFSILSAAENELVSETVLDSQTHDISTGGLRFETSLPLKEEDQLQLKLLLSESQELGVTAKVVWNKQVTREGKTMTSVGARFVELPLDEQIKLLQYFIGKAESGKVASKVASEEVRSKEEAEKVAPEEVISKEEAEKVTPEEVNSKEEAEKVELKDSSWVAGQMNQAVKSEVVVQATAPWGVEREKESKPVNPIVQALPSVLSGRAFLALHNGYHKPVTLDVAAIVKSADLTTPTPATHNSGRDVPSTAQIHHPLLDEPRQLPPGKTERVDITERLLALLDQRILAQAKTIGIMLTLEPEPPNQPEPAYYRVTLENGGFTSFSPLQHPSERKQVRLNNPSQRLTQ